uniref:Uncharacterized protein n=1 Tax=Mucochytrium quahogii TaxID=96639 RepID=A0A7S2RBT8_9STRA|mmetsp:Transcript_12741/g.27269  ORF Transcript_12741/g.27269 Transcript_12741/m.27269 type:complete len:194 (+) Transcript_12741:301-882(+)
MKLLVVLLATCCSPAAVATQSTGNFTLALGQHFYDSTMGLILERNFTPGQGQVGGQINVQYTCGSTQDLTMLVTSSDETLQKWKDFNVVSEETLQVHIVVPNVPDRTTVQITTPFCPHVQISAFGAKLHMDVFSGKELIKKNGKANACWSTDFHYDGTGLCATQTNQATIVFKEQIYLGIRDASQGKICGRFQ